MKKVIFAILDWTWCLPQTLMGFIFKLFVSKPEYGVFRHDTFTTTYTYLQWGSISLGRYIFLCEEHWYNSYVYRHEQAHTMQSYILGPLYLLVIGLPSLLWAAYFNRFATNYYVFYTEKWANKIARIKYINGKWHEDK